MAYQVTIKFKDGIVHRETFPEFVDTGISIQLFESDTKWSILPYASFDSVDVEIV